MQKIDFVLPWVDGSNQEWLEIRKKYQPQKRDSDSQSNARFRDMETLKYVLRGIEKNCPWYNKIYLITSGHYPTWLNINHDKVVLISHKELFVDKSHLPTFNSVSIEMNLVNIKDLSEKFVYLNDDMVIMRHLKQERFFKNNKPVDFFVHGWFPRNKVFEIIKKRDSWIYSLNNTLKLTNTLPKDKLFQKEFLYHKSYSFLDKVSNFLLKNIYKDIFWIKHWHHPQPFLKQTIKDVFNKFKEEMLISSQNRFRDKSDLNQYIYRYWQFINGNFYPYKYNDAIISNLDSIKVLESLIKRIDSNKNINFVCFNDSVNLNDEDYEKVKKELLIYLETRFPQKASFEI